MKSPKFYKTIIAVLVILNIATVGFMWLNRPPHPPHPGHGPTLADRLELSGEKKLEVDKLEKNHHEDKQKLMEQDRRYHKELFELVGSEKSAEDVMNNLNANKAEIEAMTFNFFVEVAKHCDANQIKALHTFIEEGMLRIHMPPPPKK